MDVLINLNLEKMETKSKSSPSDVEQKELSKSRKHETIARSNRPEVFCKKGILRNLANFTGILRNF